MKSIRLIKPYLIENRTAIVLGLICLIFVDFLQLCIPRVIKWVIDDLTMVRIDLSGLMVYSSYILVLSILIGAFRYGWRRCLIGMSRRVEEGLRNRLFGHILTLSASYFNQMKTGDIMAHATNDIQHIRMATGMGIVAMTDAVVLGTATIGFMLYINVKLTLYALIPMPFIVIGGRFVGRKMHTMYQRVQACFSDLTEEVRERFAGIRIIKAYNRESESLSKVSTLSRDYISKNIRLVRLTGSMFPLMMFFSSLSMGIVLYAGGRHTIYGTITTGDFVAFNSYLGMLTWPMMAMGWVMNLLQRGKASLDRLDVIFKTQPQIADAPDAVSLEASGGKPVFHELAFKNVSFAYRSGAQRALKRIDIRIPAGMTLGIVGPPGSGKTTLLNLMSRLYDATGGSIEINGTPIEQVRLEDLRSVMAWVSQEPFLFAGTIRDNIAFSEKLTDDAPLIEAARHAALYDTIQSFPRGFETVVGEKGVILSGGQKQRIALARALYCNAPLLLLDDPVSQVDMETGNAMIQTIRNLAANRTLIIVSHRLSAVEKADKIIVLNRGEIVEEGNHEALMSRGGYYARMFDLQKIEEEFNVR